MRSIMCCSLTRIGPAFTTGWAGFIFRACESSGKAEDRESAKREFLAELEIDPANGNADYELAQIAADDNNSTKRDASSKR